MNKSGQRHIRRSVTQRIPASHRGQLAVPLLNLLVLNQLFRQTLCDLPVRLGLRFRFDGGLFRFRLGIRDRYLLIGFRLCDGGFILNLLFYRFLETEAAMIDYKNTPEGKAVRQKYADLLPLSRPEPLKPRMTLENRAKIFSPFAALRGYEDEISAEGMEKLKVDRIEMSDGEKEILSDNLQQLRKGMFVRIRYFKGDESGYYKELSGTIDRIDTVSQELRIMTGEKKEWGKVLPAAIAFDDIGEINGEGIDL